jgi:hypothetical protein
MNSVKPQDDDLFILAATVGVAHADQETNRLTDALTSSHALAVSGR